MNLVLLTISSGQLTSYFNYAFIAIAVIGLIGFLIGFFRGVWKETISLVYYLVCFLCLIFAMPSIVNFVYNFDIHGILSNIVNPDTMAGVNSLGDLLEKGITDYIVSNNLGSAAEAVNFASQVSLSILSFAIFIIFSIVFILLEMIICPLLYHLIFKWFVPKRIRKKHKIKLVSGLMRFVSSVVITCLFLSPFTALLTSSVNKFRGEDGKLSLDQNNTNEAYQLASNILEGYNNSILASLIYSISKTGKGIDVELMDKITGFDIDDNHLNFYEEFGNLSEVLVEALASGAFDITSKTIDLTILVQSEFIKNAFYSLADSTLICVAFPIVTTLAVNGVGNNMDVDFSNVDMNSISWSDSIRAVGDIFDAIKQTGYIETAIQDPENAMDKIVISREKAQYIHDALDIFGSTGLITTLMPQMLVSYLTSMRDKAPQEEQVSLNRKLGLAPTDNIYQTLPDEAFEVETYTSIDWSKEFTDMLDIVLDVSDQFKTIKGTDLTLKDVTTMFTPESVQNVLLGIDDSIVYDDPSDYDNNVYLNGGTVNDIEIVGTKRILGCDNDETHTGLLDLQIVDKLLFDFGFIKNYLPNLFKNVIDDQELLDQVLAKVENWNVSEWKTELGSLLELAVPLYKTSNVLTTSNDVLTSISEGEGNVALCYMSDHMDGSYFISKLIPNILQNFIEKEENDMDLFLGLKLSSLNFVDFTSTSSFGQEFGFLVKDLLKQIVFVKDLGENGSNPIDTMVESKDAFVHLLESIYSSQILNKVLSEQEQASGLLSNFNNMMVKLFAKPTSEEIAGGEDLSLNIPTMTNDLLVVDRNLILSIEGTKGWVNEEGTGEIASLFNVIGALKKTDEVNSTQYIYDTIKGNGNVGDHIYEMGEEIQRIFATVDSSILMKDAFPKTLNNAIKDDPTMSKYVNFEKVESWEDEGIAFADTLDSIYELQKGSSEDVGGLIQLADKDLLKEFEFNKPENKVTFDKYSGSYPKFFIENSKAYHLLNAINSTQSFDLISLLYDSVYELFNTDPNGSADQLISDETLEASRNDFLFEKNSIKYNDKVFVDWTYNPVNDGVYYGEIYNMSRLLATSSSLQIIEELSNDLFAEVLETNIQSYPFRRITGELIGNSMRNLRATTSVNALKSIMSDDAFDFDALSRLAFDYSETDEIKNRQDEVSLRSQEMAAISNLYANRYSLLTFQTILEITEGGVNSILSKLMNVMHGSEYFNSKYIIEKKANGHRTNFTAFEKLINEIIKMEEKIAPYTLTIEELETLNNRQADDKWVGEDGEIVKFNNSLKIITSLDTSSLVLIDSYILKTSVNKYFVDKGIGPIIPDEGAELTPEQKVAKAYAQYKVDQEALGLPVLSEKDWLTQMVISGTYPEGLTKEDVQAMLGK